MIDNSIDDMTATAFRQAYGVPVVSLGETRETLSMQREALRECYGDTWREGLDAWIDDTSDEDTDQDEPITRFDARGFNWSITAELVDGLED